MTTTAASLTEQIAKKSTAELLHLFNILDAQSYMFGLVAVELENRK